MDALILIIALQQGLFSLGWWIAAWLRKVSPQAAGHWAVATTGAGLALVLIAQRGRWPDAVTIVVANVMLIASFVAIRRGVQIFLRIPRTDRESMAVVVVATVALSASILHTALNPLPVYTASALLSWTLLRCAREAWNVLRAQGEVVSARLVATTLGALGAVQFGRFIVAIVQPSVAARPLMEGNAFNTGMAVVFMTVGTLLNMVLGYLVVNRLVRRLQRRAVRDPLTGLHNRRGLASELERESARLRRSKQSYALLAIDVDHFKRINDNFGHATGDAVLAQLGRLLQDQARQIDTAARLGGEEFCLLLPLTDIAGAQMAAERLCQLAREAPWPREVALTISIGVAVATPQDGGPDDTLARADAALMRAKAGGRDQVVVSRSPAPDVEAASTAQQAAATI